MYHKKKYIVENINQLTQNDKIKILSILNIYQYKNHLKECKDGIRIDMSLISDEHINNIFDILYNIINNKINDSKK